MARVVLLDSGPLGLVTHPRAERGREAREWMADLVSAGVVVVLPEIVDYELRRKMLHIGSASGVRRLDLLKENVEYAPLTTAVMLRAASLCAEARKQGLPTSPEERLDVDVILASQTLELTEESAFATVATGNPRHLSRFVDASNWRNIKP